MPFVFLVACLLGGGLICLLAINTTLGSTSFQISQLQHTNANLAQQQQALQHQVSTEESPAQLAREAAQLGMRPETQLNFLNLGNHRVYRDSGQAGAGGQGR
ncbi:MAG TPA: hypothetical protein VGI58_16265 [Streptosporangiaceae bacterium]|jgi:hypothetical protein